jgi:hypothetical protein
MRTIARRIRDFLAAPALDAMHGAVQGPDAATQIGLTLSYRAVLEAQRPLPRFDEVGFRCHSQTDEDGILLFLFAVLGVTNKRCVEICAGDGVECNTANLILNHGWNGLLVDGDERNVERGLRFYGRSRRTYVYPPEFLQAWVTRDSVNDLLRSRDFAGAIDLLSLDMDGIDYWIWEALDAVTPRVVVLEYQDILGPDRCWTVPYADDFRASDYPMTGGQPDFAGASLAAYVKLGRRKGYRLVGTNQYGYNAFFVRNGLRDELLPEIDAHACFGHPKVVRGMRERFPRVERLPWVEV